MNITKKELLEITGISYGQLYRWKRVGLIPDSWFIKQASFTGQETIFPKDKMLTRIHDIQHLKDQYSLEELAKMLNSEMVVDEVLDESSLIENAIVPLALLNAYKEIFHKETMEYKDALYVYAFEKCRQAANIDQTLMCALIKENQSILQANIDIKKCILILQHQKEYYVVIQPEECPIHLDIKLKVVSCLALTEVNDELKRIYKQSEEK